MKIVLCIIDAFVIFVGICLYCALCVASDADDAMERWDDDHDA